MLCEFCNIEDGTNLIYAARIPHVVCPACALIYETTLATLMAIHHEEEAKKCKNLLSRILTLIKQKKLHKAAE